MEIRVKRQAKVSKQTLLDGVDPPKWRVCGHDLNQSVHETMKDISNVKLHLKTHNGNVLIRACQLIRSNMVFILNQSNS